MAWQVPISTTSVISLGTADSVIIASQVIVNSGISGTGIGHQVRVKGTAAGNNAISLGDNSTEGQMASHRVDIAGSGDVYGLSIAISIYGTGNQINNEGHVEALSNWGIYVRGVGADKQSTITNSGSIIGDGGGISISSANTQTIVLNNTGLIQGGTYAYGPNSFLPSNVDLITNAGTIIGDVKLGALGDLYDGRKGQVHGVVYGEAGIDRLYGGVEANIFFGDAGADRLQGGLGADELHGGTDADDFVFVTIGDSRGTKIDVIADFSVGEADQIDLSQIDADTGRNKNQAFDFIDGAAFSKSAGELRVINKAGDTLVSGDVNGDRKADFVIEVTGNLNLSVTDFML